MIPSPWIAVVLMFGAFRIVRLIGWDDLPIFVRWRARATGEVVYRNPTKSRDDEPIYRYDRPVLAKFIECAFCQGFWVSLAVYLAWVFEPTWTLYGLAVPALSAAVGLIAKNLDG